MKARDLRDRSTEDLAELELSLSGESFQNKFKNFTNRLDDTSVIKKSKRDLARVKLILAERARGITVVYKAAEAAPHRPKTRAPKPAPVVEVAETSDDPGKSPTGDAPAMAPAEETKKTPAKKKPAKTAAKVSHPTHISHAPKAKAKAEPAHKPAAKKTKARTEKSK
jgi:large subunit ribosomal protein L29